MLCEGLPRRSSGTRVARDPTMNPRNMTTRSAPRCVGAIGRLAFAFAMACSSVAFADDPRSAPGFERQETNKQYPAPLSQTTQPSYVPQSVALSGPKQLEYDEGQSVPPGYTPVEKKRKGPIIAGAVVLGS